MGDTCPTVILARTTAGQYRTATHHDLTNQETTT